MIKAEWTNADTLDLQPTCNQLATDCISRQAAIDALDALCDRECEYSKKQRNVMCGACHLGSAFDVIEQLPSAQPEPKWIPVSEKLPDRVGFYWTTAVGGSGTRTMTSRFFDGTKWERKRRDYTKVVAWMPLPEPYKGDDAV